MDLTKTHAGDTNRDFRLGDWLVQPRLNQVTGSSGSARIEPKMMEVLTYLAQRAGDVVSREELLQAVWKDTYVSESLLFRHVSYLRRQLGDDAKEPKYIETVARKGYRLVAQVSFDTPAVTPAVVATAPRHRFTRFKLALAAAAVLPLVAVAVLRLRPNEGSAPKSTERLAILYFENNSGDPTLDWLRIALADMLATDLSQSRQFEVLGGDRVYQTLKEMKRLDERTYGSDVIREFAQRARADRVLLGSFVKAGDRLRIDVKLLDARSGEILVSDKVTGTATSELFDMVDTLTRLVMGGGSPQPTAPGTLDRDLKDVTTASIEAYRYYVEGNALHFQVKEDEAIVLFKKAVESDPSFAMAMAKLSVANFILGRDAESDRWVRLALQHVSRLTLRERCYIEGVYYERRDETRAKAIESYRKAVELYPGFVAARHNLGRLYADLDRFDEAAIEFEELRRQGHDNPGLYQALSLVYDAQGDFDKGQALLERHLRSNPEGAAGYIAHAIHLSRWGKIDQAAQAFEKAEQLRPGDLLPVWGRSLLAVEREDWASARELIEKLVASPDPYWRWLGLGDRARLSLYSGRARAALVDFDETVKSFPDPGEIRASGLVWSALLRLELGNAREALADAEKAQQESPGHAGEWEGLFAAALCYAKLDRWDEAERTAQTLRKKAETLPTEREMRRYHHLAGELALARGDSRTAIQELQQAERMLPPRGTHGMPPHVPIWFSLASAYLAAGDDDNAVRWFERVTSSGFEHVTWPVHYVRSYYFLGKVHQRRGETAKMHASFARFAQLWKESELDRDRLQEALWFEKAVAAGESRDPLARSPRTEAAPQPNGRPPPRR